MLYKKNNYLKRFPIDDVKFIKYITIKNLKKGKKLVLFILFYLYIHPPDSQKSCGGANI